MLNSKAEYREVDRAAQMGDQVNIDYKGLLDGEAFKGGTAEGYGFDAWIRQLYRWIRGWAGRRCEGRSERLKPDLPGFVSGTTRIWQVRRLYLR